MAFDRLKPNAKYTRRNCSVAIWLHSYWRAPHFSPNFFGKSPSHLRLNQWILQEINVYRQQLCICSFRLPSTRTLTRNSRDSFVLLIVPVSCLMPTNSVAENVFGTLGESFVSFQIFISIDVYSLGTICWSGQILPQIWKSYREKSTEGLSHWLM